MSLQHIFIWHCLWLTDLKLEHMQTDAWTCTCIITHKLYTLFCFFFFGLSVLIVMLLRCVELLFTLQSVLHVIVYMCCHYRGMKNKSGIKRQIYRKTWGRNREQNIFTNIISLLKPFTFSVGLLKSRKKKSFHHHNTLFCMCKDTLCHVVETDG